MGETPKDLGWVGARAGFSIDAVFRQLLENVQGDVAAWKALRKGSQNEQMEVLPYPEYFAVRRESYRAGRTDSQIVQFRRTDTTIEVQYKTANKDGDVVTVVPKLEPSGRWHFVGADDHRLEEWEVRRDALEQLFFESRAKWADPPQKESR